MRTNVPAGGTRRNVSTRGRPPDKPPPPGHSRPPGNPNQPQPPGPLTVTINKAAGQPDPSTDAVINFSVVFSAAITGFTSGGLDTSGTTAPGTYAFAVTGTGASFNVAVTGMSGAGNVVLSVQAGAAIDEFGQSNSASTSTDNVVAWSPPAPPLTGPLLLEDGSDLLVETGEQLLLE